MVHSWGFSLPVCSGGNKRTRHRYQVCLPLLSFTSDFNTSNFESPLGTICCLSSLHFPNQFQLTESVGSCLWCTWASCPAEGAVGLLYRPAVQGHWQRSQYCLSFAVILLSITVCLNYGDSQLSYEWVFVAVLTHWFFFFYVMCMQISTRGQKFA